MTREWDRAYAEASGDWSEYVKKWGKDHTMTNRMAIVPWKDAVYNPHDPSARKVSPAQHRAAMVALQNSKWPFMPADQRSEIVDIVIAAFGLEKAE